jgi:putative intracellular protease/amidase
MAACAAPEFFVKYDMLSPNAKITCYPSQVDEKIKQHYVKKNVVISDNFITTAGPGTVAEFAIEVVKKFISPSKASEINKAMLYI